MAELTRASELLRLTHVSRWGIVRTAVPQDVASHSWRVWMLVHRWGPAFLSPEEQKAAEHLALIHDVPEIRTGDVPTPAKTDDWKEMLKEEEYRVYPPLREAEENCSQRAKDLVHFCDKAESVAFLKVNGLGRHAREVYETLTLQAKEFIMGSSSFSTEDAFLLIALLVALVDET